MIVRKVGVGAQGQRGLCGGRGGVRCLCRQKKPALEVQRRNVISDGRSLTLCRRMGSTTAALESVEALDVVGLPSKDFAALAENIPGLRQGFERIATTRTTGRPESGG